MLVSSILSTVLLLAAAAPAAQTQLPAELSALLLVELPALLPVELPALLPVELPALLPVELPNGDLLVLADLLHTSAGPPIEAGAVVVRAGKIEYVGAADAIQLPDDLKVLRAAVVTPGLVDAHSCAGLAGWLNTPADQDERDDTGPMQPELRALDAYNAREPLVAYLREFGITTLHTGHAPTALIAGQTMVVKTRGRTVAEAALVPEAMVVASLTEAARGEGGPGTPAKSVAMLRGELLAAQDHANAVQRAADAGDPPPARDLRKETLGRVLSGELPLMITAHRQRDIESVVRLAAEFEGARFVLDGAAEILDVIEPVRAAGIPIVLHPTMYRAGGETENLGFTTAAKLHAAGVPFSIQSGYEAYVPRTRVVLFEAAAAAGRGLPPEAALTAITIEPARMLGLDARIGSLEVGKDADLALFDGDPFETTSHCIGTVIDGLLVATGERDR